MPSAAVVERAWRSLRHSPALLVLSAITLALGIATFAGAFTLVDALLLTPPPFPNHTQVVVFGEKERGVSLRATSPMLWEAVGSPPGVVSRGAARSAESVNVGVDGRLGLLRAQRVDAGYLPTLGIVPALGATVEAGDDTGIVVSTSFWREWLGADPSAAGRTVRINGHDMVVRGVLPAGYRLQAAVDILLPLDLAPHTRDNAANLIAFARLSPSMSPEAFARYVRETVAGHAAAMRVDRVNLPWYGAEALDTALVQPARTPLLIFFTCGLLVLLVAGINLSNLMLTRAVERAHEAALAVAFGAHGWRSRLTVIADVTATSVVACALAIPAAALAVWAVRDVVPDHWLITADPIVVGWHTTVVAILAAGAVSVLAALVGSIQERPDRLLRMHLAVANLSRASFARRARSGMVLVQISLATLLVLLSVASLERWWVVSKVRTGFTAELAAFAEISPDTDQFPTLADVRHATDAIRTSAMARRGTVAAGVTTQLPVGRGFVMPFHRPGGQTSNLQYVLLSPGASEAMGLHLVAGRGIAEGDTADSTPVVMVNEAYLARVDPRGVGAYVMPASRLAANVPGRIVGVVEDTPRAGAQEPSEPTVYLPLAQVDAGLYAFVRRFMSMYVVVRGPMVDSAGHWPLQDVIDVAAPGLAAGPSHPLGVLSRQATEVTASTAMLLVPAAALALALSCIGLYSVQAIDVATRRRDIALRGALGATPVDMFGFVLSRGIGTAMPGVSLGLLKAVALQLVIAGRVPSAQMDMRVTSATALLMIVATLAAVALPSLRAARTPPLAILRGELAPRRRPLRRPPNR